jgi:hypothetical protein
MYYELFFITGPCTLLLGCITLTTRHRSTTEWELSGPIRGLYRSWLESAQTTCKAVFSRRRPMRSRADARGPPRIHTGGGKRKREDTHAELPMAEKAADTSPRPGAAGSVAHAHAYRRPPHPHADSAENSLRAWYLMTFFSVACKKYYHPSGNVNCKIPNTHPKSFSTLTRTC